MSVVCAWCGAHYDAAGDSCGSRYSLVLAKEFEDPAYGLVHHLTVPAYMLQHNRYSRAGWPWARNLIAAFVRDGLDPAEARRQQRAMLDSGERDWAVTRGPTFERFEEITWTRTIADVRFDSADVYCADVRVWARSVVEDSEAVVLALTASK